MEDYKKLLADIEELESIRAYDARNPREIKPSHFRKPHRKLNTHVSELLRYHYLRGPSVFLLLNPKSVHHRVTGARRNPLKEIM